VQACSASSTYDADLVCRRDDHGLAAQERLVRSLCRLRRDETRSEGMDNASIRGCRVLRHSGS